MKRTFLVAITVLFVLMAVQVKAQTKEETINWIIEKIDKYGDDNCEYSKWSEDGNHRIPYGEPNISISGDENEILITDNKVSESERQKDRYEHIPFSKITSLEITTTDHNTEYGIIENSKGMLVLKSYNYFYGYWDGKQYFSERSLLNINCATWQREPNLADRMVKAFQHLAELNRKELEANKPKETF